MEEEEKERVVVVVVVVVVVAVVVGFICVRATAELEFLRAAGEADVEGEEIEEEN